MRQRLRTSFVAVALAVVFALAFTGCKTPVHDRIVPDWSDDAAVQAIADDLSAEEARLFLGYAKLMKPQQLMTAAAIADGSEVARYMQTMAVRQGLFIAREVGAAD